MERCKKIAIIGHFGGNENILDGQTIKTKILYDELVNATSWKIRKVDTYYKSKRPIKLLLDTVITLLSTKDIIILLSGNGMRVYFPLLNAFSRVFKTRVYHDAIGGNLDTYVKRFPKFREYLRSFKVNWVETQSLRKKLGQQGISNCEVIPNFKRLDIAKISEEDFTAPFRFCIFSRVMKEKGIETAIEAIEEINSKYAREICQLDIFGRVDDGYKARFDELLKKSTNAIKYKGMISYDKSVEAISGYYALLFPTFWRGEGFPGTIVDAFSAGLPVIATDWNCNSEIVINGMNGILYPNNEIKNLKDAIEWMISNKDQMFKLKKNCIETAKKYQPDEYVKTIVLEIGEK